MPILRNSEKKYFQIESKISCKFERVEEDIHVLVECPDEPDQVAMYKPSEGLEPEPSQVGELRGSSPLG
ncbi:hypothetical protein V7S43_001540 [Phytophthora oleae]|uniref:Uncharacterized protein n=1 Tax=Phytophthora oleae TaxID=2107226 RepID=A0ABD3G6N5_9STRA